MSTAAPTDTAELAALRAEIRRLKSDHADAIRELQRLQDLRENDPLRLMHVQDAIAAYCPQATDRESQCSALERICHVWRVGRAHDAKVAAAADKAGHAGLQYLASEIDWAAALTHGCSEALVFVEQLTRAVYDCEVTDALKWLDEPPVNEEDTWLVDERE